MSVLYCKVLQTIVHLYRTNVHFRSLVSHNGVDHGSPTRNTRVACSPPRCVMRPAAIFVNYVYDIKITQKYRRISVPLSMIFTREALEPTHGDVCGPLLKVWTLVVSNKNSVIHNSRRLKKYVQIGALWSEFTVQYWLEFFFLCRWVNICWLLQLLVLTWGVRKTT
jgi:hypothetical protein